ncbi:hypothetical protein C8Q70DRAFT_1034673 [Cubamyces menziesii]|nr:hypothetical protein C8Q70DRAFT_1034673 [Cubamyces menziesii]
MESLVRSAVLTNTRILKLNYGRVPHCHPSTVNHKWDSISPIPPPLSHLRLVGTHPQPRGKLDAPV